MGGRTTFASTASTASTASAVARLASAACLALGLGTGACERPPSADSAKEWTPADHHSQDDDKAQAGQRAQAAQAQPKGAKGDDAAQLAEIAWRQQCATCHGTAGKGDGPMGAMMQAPDLTRAAWQTKTTDAEIAAVIQSGRNKMPKFDLPEPVLRGLVARIRSLQGS
jgi:cytochrome c oxidase cbb3-type subunit 3